MPAQHLPMIMQKMAADQVMVGDALPFYDLMQACAEIADRANGVARPK